MPAMNKPYRIETDASDYGCGAVLLQPSDNDPTQWNPVAYESKKFSAPERSYPPQERELLGIIGQLGVQATMDTSLDLELNRSYNDRLKLESYTLGHCASIGTIFVFKFRNLTPIAAFENRRYG
ncbi:hypothetical protein G6F63_015864 [Rhizopus arrhizus]|uniref:Reverse transcriptase/retrotransposon-derived protein RNase H-like domain-containing protein n=1 Tax=Rhizopus oryzae TaxID=64495 RepID=A0A9P6WVC7_RHIOR|nr:hypothetical protein G6F30_014300 [Rhizopus arrhizus]KAG0973133.1 hypothetical protein G6F28_013726 [Rhizopus arrhizus]KAG1010402.1 hypothetical protein G6F25_014345 [Rhizopus arrhizus]KAG1051547.1 hypothetical protein G6F41_014300 [Rhizopus arrhizus]KAG1078971.1 hypothetical protein G6F39_014316 [Rhizopus arrhizus]